jgi:glycosyltransferase involved in cell wall biosynthesis
MSAVEPQPFSNDALIVGYVGSLVPHRSLDVIVDTIGQMSDGGVRLVLGGFGPLENELRSRAQRYPNVTFLGWVDDADLMSTMGGFDVFVQIEDPNHPAYRWVSPNKVFESMALGRPIVVAQGTLTAERVAQSGHGLTVRYGDAQELRAALLSLRDEPVQRVVLGAAGRHEFEARWRPEAVTDRVLSAYDRLRSDPCP